MAKVKIQGHASGTGVLTVTAPNTSTDRTITLPDGDVTMGVGIDDNANATAITIDSSENVGIGTSSPDKNLHIESSTDPVEIRLKQTSNTNGLLIKNFNGGETQLVNADNADMVFKTNDTERMRIDSTGAVTMPAQPAFSAYHATGTQDNIAINTWTALEFANEFFDQNSDFNTSTYTFTAPVTGKYQLNLSIRTSLDSGALYYHTEIKTSNSNYRTTDRTNAFLNSDVQYYTFTISALADMDAGDTAYVNMYQSGGTAEADISGESRFSGYLVA